MQLYTQHSRPVIDIQDFVALALGASYSSAELARKKKALALIENKFSCWCRLLAPGKPELEPYRYLPETSSRSLNTIQSLLHCTVVLYI